MRVSVLCSDPMQGAGRAGVLYYRSSSVVASIIVVDFRRSSGGVGV